MTQDEIIELARQAATGMLGFTSYTKDPTGTVLEYYTRLINLATAKEREACAKVSHPPQSTEQERDEILQAITDPENQPSQFGTVTLEYHQEKMKQWEDLFDRMSANFERASDKAIAQRIVPLYTISPQRTWVGLTTEETLDMFDLNNVYGSKWIEFARTVEAKLKEKNT
jgi:hypothetical protein